MAIPVGEYESLARQVLEVYNEAELTMIRRVARRLLKGVNAPGWAERKLSETAQVHRQLSELLAALAKNRGKITSDTLETAYADAQKWCFADAKAYAQSIGILHIAPNSAKVADILSDLNRRLDAADRRILRQCDDAYADVIADASALVATGSITYREAVGRALRDFADKGISSFVDCSGRTWQMGTYAEMAVLTAITQATVSGYTDTMQSYGYDLAMISSHMDACPLCEAWQGVVVSVSGTNHRYPSLDDAYAAGVFHPRCLHHISIYHEGITHGTLRSRPQAVQQPSEGYTARSRQRYCERQIRRYKRRQAAAATPEEEREAFNMVRKWQRITRQHIQSAPTTLLRHYDREGGRVKLSDAARKMKK